MKKIDLLFVYYKNKKFYCLTRRKYMNLIEICNYLTSDKFNIKCFHINKFGIKEDYTKYLLLRILNRIDKSNYFNETSLLVLIKKIINIQNKNLLKGD